MSRRPLSTILGVAALGLTAVLLPVSAASAAVAPFNIVIAPNHGVPGAAVVATITTPVCAVGTVTVTGAYIDIDGQDATTPPVVATKNSTTDWTAALTVPADAARTSLSDSPVTFTATTTCVVPPPGSQTAAAQVVIDDLAASVIRVSPGTVTPGSTFSFSISGCTTDLVDLFFVDGNGDETSVPQGNVSGSAPTFSGTFKVPANAAEGDGDLVAECTQAGEGSASLTIAAAAVAPPTPVAPPVAPVAVPVAASPSFTG